MLLAPTRDYFDLERATSDMVSAWAIGMSVCLVLLVVSLRIVRRLLGQDPAEENTAVG